MERVRVVPISQARAKLAALVDEVGQRAEPCFIASRSSVRAVLLSVDEYNALLDRLEDLEDSLEIMTARANHEPSRPLEAFVRELEDAQARDVPRPD